MSDTYNDLPDHAPINNDKTKDIKVKCQDKSAYDAASNEMDFGGKKNYAGILLDEQSKKDGKLKSVCQEAPVIKADVSLEMGSVAEKNANKDNGEKKSQRLYQDKDKEKAINKNDLSIFHTRLYQGSGADASGVNVHDNRKGSKEQLLSKKSAIRF